MFKILIGGRTVQELKANIRSFVEDFEGDDEITEELESQPVNSEFVAPPSKPSFAEAVAPRLVEKIPNLTAPASAALPQLSVAFERDSRGIPWDERIHAHTKATKTDGSWRTRRGVEPSLVTAIELELKAQAGPSQPVTSPSMIPPVPASSPIPAVSQTPVAPAEVQPAPQAQTMVAVPVSPAPVVVAPPPPMPTMGMVHTLQTFKANFTQVLAQLVNEKKINQDYINTLKTYFGVEQIWECNETQIEQMFEGFVTAGMLMKAAV